MSVHAESVRAEGVIESEIEAIRDRAAQAGRLVSAEEQDHINDLIVERAASQRVLDAAWRAEYVAQQHAFWRPKERAKLRAALRPSPIFAGLLGVAGVSGYLLATAPAESMVKPLTIVFILSAWIASVCVHEFGHALPAYLGGDRGIAGRGGLSLDPRRYTNPLLSIALPVVFLLMGGIGLPGGSVMVETSALRSRRWELLVSAGGPIGSVVCLLVMGFPFLLGVERWTTADNVYFWAALAGLVKLEAVVLVLNLLPIPPLDGFRILSHWMPDHIRAQAFALGFMPVMLLYFVLAQPSPLTDGFWNMADSVTAVFSLPFGYAEYALSLLSLR